MTDRSRAKALAALVVATFGWGSAGTFTKLALEAFPPVSLLVAELVAANVVLWVVLLMRGHGPRPPLRLLMVLGCLEPGLAYALITLGLVHTTASNSAVITGTESCMVILLAAVLLKERLGPLSVLGTALALAGVFVLQDTIAISEFNAGDLLVLLGVLSAAFYVIVARRVACDVDALTMTAYQFAAGLAVLLPLATALWLSGAETMPSSLRASDWGVVVLVGVVGFGGSFLLYNYAIASVPASIAAILLNLMPIFGLGTAILVLGESLTLAAAIGTFLILVSIAVFPVDEEGYP
jgi:drug/metabolite transporter (DMT)-like permease